MAGQTPTPVKDLSDEIIRMQLLNYASGAGIFGVAERTMFFETFSYAYTTAEGSAATAHVYAFPAGQAPTLANVANGRQLSSTSADLNSTTNTGATARGSSTGNLVKAGETVALIGTSTSTLAGLRGEARFTTCRH